jgi:hypothetical protein
LIWGIAAIDWINCQRFAQRSLRLSRGEASRALAFAALAIAVTLLHPIYYLSRLGVLTPQQLNGGYAASVPSPKRYLSPLIDPDIGFVAWLPFHLLLALAGATLLVRSMRQSRPRRELLGLAAACGIGMAIWFLFVFAQTTNVNNGGTVHITRYALWLLPLTLPCIAAAINALDTRFSSVVLAASLALFAVYAVIFHPDQPERYVEHSPQSIWLIDHAPGLYRPLPEVFVERTLHIDGGPRLSAADPACRMVFVLATQRAQPCPLTTNEQAAVTAQFSTGDEAVWVRRAKDGTSDVTTALPERGKPPAATPPRLRFPRPLIRGHQTDRRQREQQRAISTAPPRFGADTVPTSSPSSTSPLATPTTHRARNTRSVLSTTEPGHSPRSAIPT